MLTLLTGFSTLLALFQARQPFNTGSGVYLLVFFMLLMLRELSKRPTVAIVAFAAGICTLGMVAVDLPLRMSFLVHRHLLDRTVHTCLLSSAPCDAGDRLGIYTIDRMLDDQYGGQYLRTHSEGDGPNIISKGFAYNPHQFTYDGYGGPFGSAQARWRHLDGDWWAFSVSDDY